MAEITVQIRGDKVLRRKIKGFEKALPRQIKKGFHRAGGIFLRSIREKISGEGFVRNPGRAKPYPGIYRGEMFRTLLLKVVHEAGGVTLRVGPNVDYAVFQEYGTRHIPARPFVGPTLEEEFDEAMDAIQEEVIRPLR